MNIINYPIVYSNFETAFTGFGLAILEQAYNVHIRDVVNGEYKLYLAMPRNSAKWQYIQSENFIVVEGQRFRIRTFDEIRDNTGKLLSNIQCEHVWYDAAKSKHLPDVEFIGELPNAILQNVFSGTRFNVTSEVNTLTDIFDSKSNPAKVTTKIIEQVGGELDIDNYNIVHRMQRGQNRGVQIRIGKNCGSVKKTTDSKPLVTRLYPYGVDDLDITSVNSGVSYIDSPHIGEYDQIYVTYIDYKDIEDPAELLETAQKEFTVNHIDIPKVTYEAEIVELKKLMEYGSREAIYCGDTVKLIDEGLGTEEFQRIMEYDRYPYEAKRSTVVIANPLQTDGRLIAGLIRTQQVVNKVTTARNEINGKRIDISQNTAIVQTEQQISLKADKAYVDDVEERVSSAEIKITPEAITSTVRESVEYQNDLGGINNRIDEAETQIEQTAQAITLKADKTVTDDLGTRMEDAELKITPTAITNTVRSSVAYTGDLAGKASNESVSTAKTEAINTATANANDYTDEQITPIESRVSEAELKITDSAIVNTVRSSTAYSTDLSGKASNASVETAKSEAIDTATENANGYTDEQVTPIISRVAAAELKITDSAIINTVVNSETYQSDLSEKADNDTVGGINSRLEVAELKITPEAIKSTVLLSEDYTGEINEIYTQIDQNAYQINQKVAKGGEVFSEINLDSSGAKIYGSKINLYGVVTIYDLASETRDLIDSKTDTAQVTTITNTTVSTTNVEAQNLKVRSANIQGQLSATQINTYGLGAQYLYSPSNSNMFAEIGGVDNNNFIMYNYSTEVFRISDTYGSGVNMYSRGLLFLQTLGSSVRPNGNWNFADATVDNIPWSSIISNPFGGYEPIYFAPATHYHDDRYSNINHNHDYSYAGLYHNHDLWYIKTGGKDISIGAVTEFGFVMIVDGVPHNVYWGS